MKKLLLLLLVLVTVLPGWSQAPPASAQVPTKAKPVSPLMEYTGEWSSVFDGKVWLALHLELRGEQLSGRLVHPKHIEMNDNGELKSVSEEQSTEEVTEAVVNPDGLLLNLKDVDTQEQDRYQMRLILPDKNIAELKMIGMPMPPGMPKPKPWRVTKSGDATKPKAEAPR